METDVQLALAQPSEWAACEPYLIDALEHTKDWTLPDVALAVVRGQVALWAVREADGTISGAGITGITQYTRRRVLDVFLFAGTDFSRMVGQLRDAAISLGCDAIAGRGRKGWVRALPGAKDLHAWEVEV